jgi:hypothetical protein
MIGSVHEDGPLLKPLAPAQRYIAWRCRPQAVRDIAEEATEGR